MQKEPPKSNFYPHFSLGYFPSDPNNPLLLSKPDKIAVSSEKRQKSGQKPDYLKKWPEPSRPNLS